MDRTPACYVFLGLLVGGLFGFIVGAAGGDAIHGMQLGALAGVFIGWFIAAASLEHQSRNK